MEEIQKHETIDSIIKNSVDQKDDTEYITYKR